MDNYPLEHHDDFDGEPLPDNLIERGFDEDGNLRFQDRMMLCMDSINELEDEQECALNPRVIVRMTKDWSLDAIDRTLMLDDVCMFLDIYDDIARFISNHEDN